MNNANSTGLDLPAYFARIHYDGPTEPTLSLLSALHALHATSIPFENIDIQLGRAIRLDLPSIQQKLITARRGGYCFEQNTLFAAVLQALGVQVTTLAARVRYLTTERLPKTHMTLKVDLPEGPFLADVGFGGNGLTSPLRLVLNEPQVSDLDTLRLHQEGDVIVLQTLVKGAYQDLYAFTLEEHYPIDYEMGNYYTSTNPGSRFVQMLLVSRASPEGRYNLRNRDFGVRRGGSTERHELDDGAILDVLRSQFGLDLPDDTRFPCLTSPR